MRRSLVAAGGAVAWFGPAAAPVVPLVARAFRIPTRLAGGRGIAITFDDGPHREGTPAVLEILDRHGARATFFLVGEQVEREPAIAAEIAAAGHAIAIHGYRHVLLLRRSPAALRDDFARAEDVIANATGAAPTLYRPPYGVFSGPALGIVHRLGWQPLLWSRWGRDWTAHATRESIAARATRDLGGGDVVLLHDADHYSSAASWRRTAAALPSVLAAAAATGEPLVAAIQDT
ncbi:MAG TPA: polysaccharide deacetylase family protein [Gaiellaceae bacterium]|nr:polysaccharide deacetylase family protein [Gaiellaceae bacterium]